MPPDRWASLSVRIVDDAEMSALHVRFMGEPGPTDVLSFPAGDPEAWLLGDIALDWEAIARQAAGPHEAQRLHEATVLCVHGLAHLLGHDHATQPPERARPGSHPGRSRTSGGDGCGVSREGQSTE